MVRVVRAEKPTTSSEVNPYHDDWVAAGLSLRDHQVVGVSAMDKWYRAGHGGINADEMGLGKTCQAIVMMLRLVKEGKGPFLVSAPLSVCEHWGSEVDRFGCGHLEKAVWIGHEAQREEVIKKMGTLKKNTVFITAHHLFRGHHDFIAKLERSSGLSFAMVVVDEAQFIKNADTSLAYAFHKYTKRAWILLMTGTPIQNYLSELYSMFSYIDVVKFNTRDGMTQDQFVSRYSGGAELEELRSILANYMIRRTKDEVCKELSSCEQVVLYHSLSDLQKKIYLDIISKNYISFMNYHNGGAVVSLNNILIQLRKCVSHPYLFKGVEPEPFEEGEHLVDASGKLQVLDRVLKYLRSHGHRVLIFSQFTMALDVVQDFLDLRDWKFERIDGTVNAEDRFESIDRFQEHRVNRDKDIKEDPDAPWCFLLSTKAGGIGLNLTAADTVIFLDADWNPQNDIQAMARCHRIGQDKPVRVIRLIGRFTVEQYMAANIREKLRFTEQIMNIEETKVSAADLIESMKANLSELKNQSSEKFDCSDAELEALIGATDEQGHWLSLKSENTEQKNADQLDAADVDKQDFYRYNGVSYRISAKDEEAFRQLHFQRSVVDENGEIAKRTRRAPRARYDLSESPSPAKAQMTWEEMVAAKNELALKAEARRQMLERRRAEQEEKRDREWEMQGYVSKNLPLPASENEGEEEDVYNDNGERALLSHVRGDVTRPRRGDGDDRRQLILHCVDDGGSFGTGGVFSSLRAKDASIVDGYESASAAGDLSLGSAHIFESLSGEDAVVLMVAQKHQKRDVLRSAVLEECFSRVAEYAVAHNCTVNISRIGHGTNTSWYTIERLLKKHFCFRGIPCNVYYYVRGPARQGQPARRHDQSNRQQKRRDDSSPDSSQLAGSSTATIVQSAPLGKRRSRPPRVVTGTLADADELLGSESSSSSCESDSENEYDPEDEEEAVQSESSDDEMEVDEEVEEDGDGVSEDGDELMESADELDEPSTSRRKPAGAKKDVKKSHPESSNVPRETKVQRSSTRVAPSGLNDSLDEMVVSLYGFDKKDVARLSDAVISRGASIVLDEKDLGHATHVIVPPEVAADEERLERFRSLFDTDSLLFNVDWLQVCHFNQSTLDMTKYIL